jgi:hypothetical protein
MDNFESLKLSNLILKSLNRFLHKNSWHSSFKNYNIKIIILFDLMLELYLHIEKHLESLPFLCIFYKNSCDHLII